MSMFIKQEESERGRGRKRCDFIQLNLIEIERKCFCNWYSGQNVKWGNLLLRYESHCQTLYPFIYEWILRFMYSSNIMFKSSGGNSTRTRIKNLIQTYARSIALNSTELESKVEAAMATTTTMNISPMRRGKFLFRCSLFQCSEQIRSTTMTIVQTKHFYYFSWLVFCALYSNATNVQ